MTTRSSQPGRHHSFFQTMVLMGASMATGCGDTGAPGDDAARLTHADSAPKNEPTADETLADGSSNPSYNSGSDAIGQQTEVPSGDVSQGAPTFEQSTSTTGGAQGIIVDRNVSKPPSGDGAPSLGFRAEGEGDAGTVELNCPPEQWTCDTDNCNSDLVLSSANCSCDDSRPSSKRDCDEGEVFVCNTLGRVTAYDASAQFQCTCVAEIGDCVETCTTVLYPSYEQVGFSCSEKPQPDDNTDEADVLCGCAYIYLK